MRRAAGLGVAVLLWMPISARAQPGASPPSSQPTANEGGDPPSPDRQPSPDSQPSPPTPDDQATEEPAPTKPAELVEAERIYQRYLRHFLPGQATQIIDTAIDLVDLYYELPALWKSIKDDPVVRAVWGQMKLQYKPTVHWSTYAGGLAESTGYAGLTAGVAVDVTAPLCRYVGAEANTHGYYYNGAGLSYDTRGTACLPWGPFSFEFGLLRQRELRVGISSAPSLPNARYNADGFEMRIRSYRWLDRAWQAQLSPVDILFRTYSVPGDDAIPNYSAFQIDGSFFRYLSYGKGFLGANRQIDAVHFDVAGVEDTQLLHLGANVLTISPIKWTGARLADDLYLDGYAGFSQARIVDLDAIDEPLENRFFFAAGLELDKGNADWQSTFRYRRRTLPDSDFRLLSEDRADASLQLVREFDLSSVSAYGAYTKQLAAPAGSDPLLSSLSYGVEGKYGRYLVGPFYLQLTATTAKSYYASIDGARLLAPELEFRALASLIASDRNY